MRVATGKMEGLIDGLLDLSRLSQSELERESLDLSSLATAIAVELKAKQPDRHVDFTICSRLVANGDPRLLRVAMENLLGNAWKYTSRVSRPTIEFGADLTNGHPVYFVRDDGVGFDMSYADRLFVAFQRLHGEKEFEGTGIGLATVERIVHRHGGEIHAERQVVAARLSTSACPQSRSLPVGLRARCPESGVSWGPLASRARRSVYVSRRRITPEPWPLPGA